MNPKAGCHTAARPCWTAILRILHGCSALSHTSISVTATEVKAESFHSDRCMRLNKKKEAMLCFTHLEYNRGYEGNNPAGLFSFVMKKSNSNDGGCRVRSRAVLWNSRLSSDSILRGLTAANVV